MQNWRLELVLATLVISTLAVALLSLPARPETVRFNHKLASFTTSLEGRTSGQKQNIGLACSLINEKVIDSGEMFSFVRTIGPTTAERGFVKSSAYVDGELRPAYGGGCCQLASTVYNAALLADLEIIERSRHIWPVRSVPEGLDAAVNNETLDLKIKNGFAFPVMLRARVAGRRLIVEFLASQPLSAQVSVRRRLLETVEAPDVLREDANLSPGAIKRQRRGRSGCRVVVERVVTSEGATKRESLSEDFYGPRNGVVAVPAPVSTNQR